MSFAKTIVVGNLGGDPELRYMPDGRPVASFSICANERRGSGDNRTETQIWFKANVFGNSAEAVAKHLQKGDQVYVEGWQQVRRGRVQRIRHSQAHGPRQHCNESALRSQFAGWRRRGSHAKKSAPSQYRHK